MARTLGLILLCLSTVLGFSQSAKYQVGTITRVKPHQATTDNSTEPTSYEVSLQVEDTTYVVLYTPVPSTETVKYAAGLDVLVLVGEKTIKYNDLLGRSIEVPIVSRERVASVRRSN